MKLHFPVSATVNARRWLVDAQAGWAKVAFPIRYGILERRDGLVLVDIGYSPELFAATDLGLRIYRRLLKPKLDPAQDAVAIVEKLCAKAADIRDIVITHLHADHVCGLGRFPNARLHMSRASLSLWASPPSRKDLAMAFYRSLMPPLDKARVRVVEDAPVVPLPWGARHDNNERFREPPHPPRFARHPPRRGEGEAPSLAPSSPSTGEVARRAGGGGDLRADGHVPELQRTYGHDIFGDGSVISIDLPGHMDGHFGLFFPQREKPLLYAVDADWTLGPLLSGREPNWPARLIMQDREAARQSAAVVRAAAEWGAEILLAHEPKPWP